MVDDVVVSNALLPPAETGSVVASVARAQAATFGPAVEAEIAAVAEGRAALADRAPPSGSSHRLGTGAPGPTQCPA